MISILAAILVQAAAPAATPQAAVACPADSDLAKLVAASDLVLIGRMEVPKQRLLEEAAKPSPEYLDIPIQVEGALKGDAGPATLRIYPQDRVYAPSNQAVIGFANSPAILFLTRVDKGPVGLYFAGYSPEALKPATKAALDAARSEVSRQAQITHSWQPDVRLPRFEEVRALITRLGEVSGKDQQQVFERLEALGEDAVPAIIAQMDDRRLLRTRAISLVNHAPNSFEGIRHYGPEKVVDGLAAILNQLTGESFGTIVNGASDRKRDAAVAGWRIYASDLQCRANARHGQEGTGTS